MKLSMFIICWEIRDSLKLYRSSGINGDKSGESGASLFSRRSPDFSNDRRSFPTNKNSNLYCQRQRPSPMNFAHYQSPKLLKCRCCDFCLQDSILGALSISSQIHNRKIWDRPLANIRYICKIWMIGKK